MVVIVISIIVFYLIYINDIEKNKKIFAKYETDFPALNHKDSCDCEIISIYNEVQEGSTIRNNPNGALLFCKTKGKMSIYTSSLELNSNKPLDEVLKNGAIILKEAYSDTVFIKYNSEDRIYKFIISN